MTQSQATPYSDDFFSYINEGSTRSARVIVPLVQAHLPIKSVLDVGCGQGAWLRVWKEQGVATVFGVDGDYVDRAKLLVGQDEFKECNLNETVELGRKFDLVQSLEVAEHLNPEASAQFIDSLTRHGDMVLFSAAPPGQGGKGHINERSYGYWADLFAQRGFVPVDFLRPQIMQNREVEFWYRYNTVLFVREGVLSEALAKHKVARVADLSPPLLWLRKQVLRHIPHGAVSCLATTKHHLTRMLR